MKSMTFKEALEGTNSSAGRDAFEGTPHVQDAWRPGLQALRAEDRPHIAAEDPRRLRGSADIDAALLAEEPHANRWDFGISYQHTDRTTEVIYWTEMHTGSDGEVKVVIRKAQWLVQWLKNSAPELNNFERDIVWVSSGATSMTLGNPKQKQMALAGLRYVGAKLRIRNNRG